MRCLPWNQGAPAVRYVHNLDLEEIERLAAECGLAVVNTFRARRQGRESNLFVIPGQLGVPC